MVKVLTICVPELTFTAKVPKKQNPQSSKQTVERHFLVYPILRWLERKKRKELSLNLKNVFLSRYKIHSTDDFPS